MLVIEGLHVEIDGKPILKDINFSILPGETHVLFGPNGSGKTSLLMTIMGYPQCKVVSGKITFKGRDITQTSITDRARLGIGMSYQRPPTVKGLKTGQMLQFCAGPHGPVKALADRLNFTRFLDRDLNAGFSGGEIKRSELLQLMVQHPDLMLFDEPESGVDMESLSLIGGAIAELLEKNVTYLKGKTILQQKQGRSKMGLIITHTGYILDYLEADKGQVLCDGILSCTTHPREILKCIREMGYKDCARCLIEKNL